MARSQFFLLLALCFPLCGFAQLCSLCNGVGVAYEKKKVTRYDNLIKTKTDWGGTDWYSYTNKYTTTENVAVTCPVCNGTGILRRKRRRPAVKQSKPKVIYLTTDQMIQRNLDKLTNFEGYKIKENFGNRYYLVDNKVRRDVRVVKVHGTKLGYETIMKNIYQYMGQKYSKDGSFYAYAFRTGKNSGYYYFDANFNFITKTEYPSTYLGFDGLFWVESGAYVDTDKLSQWGKEDLAQLIRLPAGDTLTEDKFVSRIPGDDEYDLWKAAKLIVTKEYVQVPATGWETRLGVVNLKGEYVLPPMFSSPSSPLYEFEYDPQSKLMRLYDSKTKILHYFNLAGQELKAEPKRYQRCDNGDEIFRTARMMFDEESKTAKQSYIYELRAKDSTNNIPPLYSYCTCYNEKGIARAASYGSKDTLTISTGGLKANDEMIAAFNKYKSYIDQPYETLSYADIIRNSYNYNYRIKERQGASGEPEFSISPYKKWYKTLVPIYKDRRTLYAMSNGDKYRFAFVDKDGDYDFYSTKYVDIDLTSSNYYVPVKNKKGKWGAWCVVKHVGDNKRRKLVIPCVYDSIKLVGYNYFCYRGDQVDYFADGCTNKKGKQKAICALEKPDVNQNEIDWVDGTKGMLPHERESFFEVTGIDPVKDQLTSYKRCGMIAIIGVNNKAWYAWHEKYPLAHIDLPSEIVDIRIISEEENKKKNINGYVAFKWLLQHQNGNWGIAKGAYESDSRSTGSGMYTDNFDFIVYPENGFRDPR